ncbi:TPA: hypothetical protein ACJJSX_002108 [Neisseria meningitidis]
MPSENLSDGISSFSQGHKTKTGNQKQQPKIRHSHESGNLEMKSSRHLSEMTETERTGFPLSRE